MYKKTIKSNKRAIFAVIIFTMIFILSMPTGACAANNKLTLTVNQVFTTSSSSDAGNDVFTYKFKPLNGENPMPAGSDAEGYTFTVTGTGSTEIGPIEYGSQGVYKYELFQVVTAEKQGYTYDKRIYTVEVYTNSSAVLETIVRNSDGTKAADIRFENKYRSYSDETTNPGGGNSGNGDSGNQNGTHPGKGPNTGDDSNIFMNANYWIKLIIFSGALAIGGTLYLIACRRRKGERK